MFFLPITPSPGEHGADDQTSGVLAQARRFVRQNLHMGVNGFIACALLIQGLSAAGLIPGASMARRTWLRTDRVPRPRHDFSIDPVFVEGLANAVFARGGAP